MDDLLVDHALDAADDSKTNALLDSRLIVWAGFDDEPAAIVRRFGRVSGVEVTLSELPGSLHETLLALNRSACGYRARLALASIGADGLAFVVLPEQRWQELDEDIGDALAQVVWELDRDWDPFEALQRDDVVDPYFEFLSDDPGRYGESLARALSDPGAAPSPRDADDGDELLPW